MFPPVESQIIFLSKGDNCIVFENFTASIVDIMVANIRLLAPLSRRQYTQFAAIKISN
jgi:hypothetical protein